MKKSQIHMNKPFHLGFSILALSKMLMYEFWYNYVNQNIIKKQNCVIWMQTVVYIKPGYIYKNITEDIETGFDASNYELDRLLPKEKRKN